MGVFTLNEPREPKILHSTPPQVCAIASCLTHTCRPGTLQYIIHEVLYLPAFRWLSVGSGKQPTLCSPRLWSPFGKIMNLAVSNRCVSVWKGLGRFQILFAKQTGWVPCSSPSAPAAPTPLDRRVKPARSLKRFHPLENFLSELGWQETLRPDGVLDSGLRTLNSDPTETVWRSDGLPHPPKAGSWATYSIRCFLSEDYDFFFFGP